MRGFCLATLTSFVFTTGAISSESQGVWLDVPFVAQEKNGCGAASIAMIIDYWRAQQGQTAAADARSVHASVYSPSAEGVYASQMRRYLGEHGFRTWVFRGTWGDIDHHLQKGRPLIVALKSGRSDLHYVVITGIDSHNQVVFKHDPAVRKLVKQHRTAFEKQWKGAAWWALLALPESSVSVP
jgi:ABC-type bacteriocin/lantibiotic exporter with double-glycine peptidase domain